MFQVWRHEVILFSAAPRWRGQERGEPLAKVPVETVRSLLAGFHDVNAALMPTARVRPVAARRWGSRWSYHDVEVHIWCLVEAAK